MPSRRPPKLKQRGPSKPPASRDRFKSPPPLTLGDVLVEGIAEKRTAEARKRELAEMGFTPVKTGDEDA